MATSAPRRNAKICPESKNLADEGLKLNPHRPPRSNDDAFAAGQPGPSPCHVTAARNCSTMAGISETWAVFLHVLLRRCLALGLRRGNLAFYYPIVHPIVEASGMRIRVCLSG